MSEPLSFTPAGRLFEAGPGPPVRRRRVLLIPGYDPEGETRYRRLFVREVIRYAKRFALLRREISPVAALPDLPGLAWRAVAATEDWRTEAVVEVLLWDDIVRRDFRRPLPVVVLLLLCGLVSALVTGTLLRFWRVHWKFGGVILYPALMVAAFLSLSLAAGLGADHLAARAWPAPEAGRWALTLGVAGLAFCLLHPLGERWFVWHLMHDWVFNWQHGMGWRRDYEARVDRFAAHLATCLADESFDEILVVGHSSGSSMAIDVVARALPGEGEGRAARLALLTIGSCVPLIAFNPVASAFRAAIRRLMTSRALFWAEYQAPQDWINFAGFNPLRDLDLGLHPDECRNPCVRSARFREIVSETTYRSVALRPFRMHFQFLNANDVAGEYDYVMMLLGPLTLEARVALGDASVAGMFPRGARRAPC